MFSDTCVVADKKGLLWLDRAADFAIITNKIRHDLGKTSKFAIVNPEEQWVDSVHGSQKAAASRIRRLAIQS